jgi:hypothetical protein
MNRSTLILIIIFVVLAAITYFFVPKNEEREASYQLSKTPIKVDSTLVAQIDIQNRTKSVTIENISGRWMITSPIHTAADPNSVSRLLNGLMKFEIRSLVSSNHEKQSLYEVDSTGTKLTLTEKSGKIISIIVGKMGPTFSEIYFRLPASNDVYLGEGLESWSINKEIKDWRDRTIFVTPIDSIHAVTYTVDNKEFMFIKEGMAWTSTDKSSNVNSINQAITSLSILRAEDFIDTPIDFQTRPIRMKLSSTEDIILNFYPMPPDSSKYYITTATSPQIFTISKWTAQPILKPVQKQ